MAKYYGVILDVDGTLVDSNEAHGHSWMKAINENGGAVTIEQIRVLVGMGGDHLLPAVGIDDKSDQGKRIARVRGQIFKREYLPKIRAFKGVDALVRRLEEDGYALVTASSGEEEEVEALLKIARVNDLIEERTASTDGIPSKPDPDLFLEALSLIKLEPDEAVIIGDTEYDVQAAARAGIAIVALRSGGRTDEQLTGALAIYNDAAHLLARYDESPLAG